MLMFVEFLWCDYLFVLLGGVIGIVDEVLVVFGYKWCVVVLIMYFVVLLYLFVGFDVVVMIFVYVVCVIVQVILLCVFVCLVDLLCYLVEIGWCMSMQCDLVIVCVCDVIVVCVVCFVIL